MAEEMTCRCLNVGKGEYPLGHSLECRIRSLTTEAEHWKKLAQEFYTFNMSYSLVITRAGLLAKARSMGLGLLKEQPGKGPASRRAGKQ